MRRVAILLLSLALLGASGCVTKGKYDDVVADNVRLESEVDTLEKRLSVATINVFAMGQRLREEQVAAEHARRAYEELIVELEIEVEAGIIGVALMENGVMVTLPEGVLFGSGSATLSADGEAVIRRVADELARVPYQIVAAGHSDNMPIGESLRARYRSNWDLAGDRAGRVVAVLQEEGIEPGRMLAVSFGETQPVASNDTPKGRAQNRRIEIRLRPVLE